MTQLDLFGPSLEDARATLRADLDDGTDCPCCGQYARRYRRRLNSGMARLLIDLYHWRHVADGWRHVRDFETISREVSKLGWWELVEEAEKGDGDLDGRTSGRWRITPRGERFALLEDTLPETAVVYNADLSHFEGACISIVGALGSRFSYVDLMSAKGGQ